VVDSNNAVVETTDYYPFGAIRFDNQTNNYNEKRKYIGQEYDAETSLSYLNARYYNGTIGRFVTQDPVFWGNQNLSDPQSLNAYSYANNNPITLSDPSGKWAETAFDVSMLGYSLYEFYEHPSWKNAGAVVLDAGSVALPIIPAVGGLAIRGGKGTGKAVSVIAKNQNTNAALNNIGQQSLSYAKNLAQTASSPVLKNIVKNTYRSTDTIPGGTFGALRNEIVTGLPTKGKYHLEKTQNTLNALSNLLKNPDKLTAGDLKVMQSLINDAAKEIAAAKNALK